MRALRAEGRAPRTIVLENVYGAITSHGGKDFAAICAALAEERYRFGAILIDAVQFLPQSRPRLFVVAVDETLTIGADVVGDAPDEGRRRIVAKVDALMALCDRLEESLAAGNSSRHRLLDALLPEALAQDKSL